MFWLLLCFWKQLRHWLSTTKRHENSKIVQPACNLIFIFTCSPFIVRHFNPEKICVVTTELTKFSCCSCFKFNRVWSLNKWPTRFICLARSMDTTLRFKAMEKESLTSKFLFDRCYLFVIGLFNKSWFLFNAWSVFAAYPWLLLKFHDTFEDGFGKGWGTRGRITIQQVSSKVFSSVIFHGNWFKFFICEPNWTLPCKFNLSINVIK